MLKLVRLSEAYREQLGDMMDEWTATGETIVPCAIVKNDYRDFDRYLAQLEVKEAAGGLVPDSVFFCLDDHTNRFVGAVNIRHRLNAPLLRSGGHIGDGVRPSERRRGVATRMIAMALEECRRLGIERVLMVCDKDNIASARSIQKNGGVLENELDDGGTMIQRYWIDLNFYRNA